MEVCATPSKINAQSDDDEKNRVVHLKVHPHVFSFCVSFFFFFFLPRHSLSIFIPSNGFSTDFRLVVSATTLGSAAGRSIGAQRHTSPAQARDSDTCCCCYVNYFSSYRPHCSTLHSLGAGRWEKIVCSNAWQPQPLGTPLRKRRRIPVESVGDVQAMIPVRRLLAGSAGASMHLALAFDSTSLPIPVVGHVRSVDARALRLRNWRPTRCRCIRTNAERARPLLPRSAIWIPTSVLPLAHCRYQMTCRTWSLPIPQPPPRVQRLLLPPPPFPFPSSRPKTLHHDSQTVLSGGCCSRASINAPKPNGTKACGGIAIANWNAATWTWS